MHWKGIGSSDSNWLLVPVTFWWKALQEKSFNPYTEQELLCLETVVFVNSPLHFGVQSSGLKMNERVWLAVIDARPKHICW